MRNVFIVAFTVLFIFGPMGSLGRTSNAPPRLEEPVQQAIDTRQATQHDEEAWRLEKEVLVARFEQLQQEQAQLKQQQAELEKRITSTHKRLTEKEKQLSHIQQISTQIQPFLTDLVASLQRRIAEDLPFLMQERRQRIEKLEALMSDPEVDASERYRKVMEALLVEAEYGFTIETYQETIQVADRPLLADILRLGRLVLYYQSLDGKAVGFYNVAEDKWDSLPASHAPAIGTAINIAAKRQPVELLTLPLGKLVIQ